MRDARTDTRADRIARTDGNPECNARTQRKARPRDADIHAIADTRTDREPTSHALAGPNAAIDLSAGRHEDRHSSRSLHDARADTVTNPDRVANSRSVADAGSNIRSVTRRQPNRRAKNEPRARPSRDAGYAKSNRSGDDANSEPLAITAQYDLAPFALTVAPDVVGFDRFAEGRQ